VNFLGPGARAAP
jgi:hypothetical protein